MAPKLLSALLLSLTLPLAHGAVLRPRACTFSWPAGDSETCASMSAAWGIPLADFIALNPSVGADCENGLVAGQDYCVEGDVPSGDTRTTTTTTATSTTAGSTTTTAAGGAPSPTQSGIIDSCTTYYEVVSGDTCQVIVDKYDGIFTLDEFISWNPAVGEACTGLWLGYYVCVGVPGTPTEPPTTTPTPTDEPDFPSPTQAGLAESCIEFHLVESGDTCGDIVAEYPGVTLSDFYSWNPAVGSSCASLWPGYYVCVGVDGFTPSPTPSPTGPSTPSPTQAGIPSNCNKWYQAKDGDYCQKIVDEQGGFTLSQFYAWNPAVGSSCNGLWLGYWYCIGVQARKRSVVISS